MPVIIKKKSHSVPMPKSYYMGIDSSTRTGIGIVSLDGKMPVLESTSVITAPQVDGMQRCLLLTKGVLDLAEAYKPSAVFIEGYSFASTHNGQTLIEIGTLIRHYLLLRNLKVFVVAPTTLKKFVTGKGTTKGKGPMMLWAYKQWGFDLPDDDRCDAACLAVMAAFWSNGIGPNVQMREAMQKVLKCV